MVGERGAESGGRHKVGHRTLDFIDGGRRSYIGTGPRPLRTEVWYPAGPHAREELMFLGPPGQGIFEYGPVAHEAVPAKTQAGYPLALLSHGTGGSGLGMGWLGERLARAGYVVAALDHHGNNSNEPHTVEGFSLWWERALDLTRVLDALQTDPFTAPLIDARRVVAAGFSLGGYTVTAIAGGLTDLEAFKRFCSGPDRDGICDGPREFPNLAEAQGGLAAADSVYRASLGRHARSYRDARVRAVLALAPALGQAFDRGSLNTIDTPMHVVVPLGDTEVPPATNGIYIAANVLGCEVTELAQDHGHYVFLCEPTSLGRELEPDICLDGAEVDRRAVHDATAKAALAFFDRHLR